MTTTADRRAPTMPAVAPVVDLTEGVTWYDDLRAARVVWKREIIRFARNRTRILTSLAQPVLFLFVLGTGLAPVIKVPGGFDFRTCIELKRAERSAQRP